MGEIPGNKRGKVAALHQALLQAAKETKTLGKIIPVPVWEGIIVQALGEMTRQSCQDTTWSMERLRLIKRVKHKGIIVLDEPTPPILSAQPQGNPPPTIPA